MTEEFVIKPVVCADLLKELELIGYDKSYRAKAIDKFRYKTLKIYNLSVAQANILKQLALSVGADCATHREVITGKIESSDVILGGSFSQLYKISQKLKHQPFSLAQLAKQLEFSTESAYTKTKIVGILNLTDDSFSDGGEYNTTAKACARIEELIEEGADVIDIGAESTRPHAKSVSAENQLERIIPVLEYLKNKAPKPLISIDTRSSVVAQKCLESGADIINDVSGLKFDKNMGEVISKYNAGLVLQHSLGNEVNMSETHVYKSVVDDVYNDLANSIKYAKSCGIEKIIVDVGIGFDKTAEENFEILRRINEFRTLGYPLMCGISRKSLLGSNDITNEGKDILTLVLNTLAVENKTDYIRVHNVKIHRQALDLLEDYFRQEG